jgi:glycosyltransferase involved in cell wall biosynthesis
MSVKLAIICSHPIQYYAPVYKLLAKSVMLKVFYTRTKSSYDKGFQREIHWDLPLLLDYNYEFTARIASINAFKPDFILIYGWARVAHLNIIRHFHKSVKILFRGDSTLIEPRNKFHKLLRKHFLKWLYSHIDKFFYVGTENKAYFLEHGVPEDKLYFAPHAIENDRFSKQIKSGRIRETLNIGQSETLILFAGKFIPQKNVQLLIRAFICLKLTNCHLLLVGNGKLLNSCKLMSSGHKNIHFLDFQNQLVMPEIYRSCDLFCLPSKSDSWGLAVNEAMACGKAVIVSDAVGAASDLIEPSNGRVFKSNNVNDLKSHLLASVGNKDRLRKQGLRSQAIIAKWTIDEQVSKILNALLQPL